MAELRAQRTGGTVGTVTRDIPEEAWCPACNHPHLDYTDEACVSCGCSLETTDLTIEELLKRLRAIEDHFESKEPIGYHPIVPMRVEGDFGFCAICWHEIFETHDERGGKWRHA